MSLIYLIKTLVSIGDGNFLCKKIVYNPCWGTAGLLARGDNPSWIILEKKEKAPVRLETTEVLESMTANRLTGEENKLLIEFREHFELPEVVSLVERGFLRGVLLGFLLGFASEGFELVYHFLTGNAFEGSVDCISVFGGGSSDGDSYLGCFGRVVGDRGNLGVRTAATAEVVFGEGGFAVDGIHFNITCLDVVSFFTQVEDAGREAGDVEFCERIKGSDFSVFLDVLQDA